MSVVAKAVTQAIFLNDTHGVILSRIAINASSSNQLIRNVAYNQTVAHIQLDRDGSIELVVDSSVKPSTVYGDDLKLSEKQSISGLSPQSEAWVYDKNRRILVIFADPLTITISYATTLQPQTTTTTAQPPTPPRCIIATVAYGSDLAPEVQLLRTFRDQELLSTFAGSTFLQVFNRFYYSFSPAVATILAENSGLSQIVRLLINPLIALFRATSVVHSSLGLSPEPAVVLFGIFASGAIGVLYITPVVAAVMIWNKTRQKPLRSS